METVPFEVPGSMITRGWSSGLTPTGSLSSLATASVLSQGSLGSTEALIRIDQDQTESVWTPDRGIRTQDVTCLGSIDPSLYKYHDTDDDYELPDYHIGRIWFRVQYERETEKLLVTLIKARNLPSRSLSHGNTCDPFVRLYLLPDERRYLQSKCKKKTCNPNYNEDFIFQVPQRMFRERVLKFTVFDVHKRQRVVGHATYPLQDHNPEESAYVWRDLERELTDTTLGRGEIKVSLTYNPHYERITVGVYEGRNIKQVVDRELPDFYMRVNLLIQSRVTKTKRTAVIRHTCNPVFNESFNFKLTQNQLDSASVTINAIQVYGATKDKCTGRVVLGSFMFARGKELDHWNEMISNKLQRISRWHALT
ncbi:hypothetical protein LSH36_1148g00001 [Paralvinella palmiformis]|uniref:C2 domain-containing protein n=1 Tax=Paralvinella palmiformis TaxID=53620 RepID=A0AAD9IW59_9ANNE|nr:hypothetical protein LSH36_1148g00001 [Paralvinella palmiformis]